jgi:hypothetical protein
MPRVRLTYRHDRGRPWEKPARCRIDVPDVVYGQDTGGNGAFSPLAEGGPERCPAFWSAEALWGTASPRPK